MSKAAQFQVEIDIERRYKYVTKKEKTVTNMRTFILTLMKRMGSRGRE